VLGADYILGIAGTTRTELSRVSQTIALR
jgi:hypothetical protein